VLHLRESSYLIELVPERYEGEGSEEVGEIPITFIQEDLIKAVQLYIGGQAECFAKIRSSSFVQLFQRHLAKFEEDFSKTLVLDAAATRKGALAPAKKPIHL